MSVLNRLDMYHIMIHINKLGDLLSETTKTKLHQQNGRINDTL
jgi:hypothetical protein